MKSIKKNLGLNLRLNRLTILKKNIQKKIDEKFHKKSYLNLIDNVKKNIKFLILIKSYRGLRHKNGYPVRGQRTHTNANKKTFN